jgi:hypothetical protein
MAEEDDKKSRGIPTPAILAVSAILAAVPALGLEQAIAQHGQNLTQEELQVVQSLSGDEVQALVDINTQLDKVALGDTNNNNNNNKNLV